MALSTRRHAHVTCHLGVSILFLVERDLDSGSAAHVVGIAKRARPHPTEPNEMPRACFWGAKHTQLTIAYRCICINGLFSPLLISRYFYQMDY